MTVIEPNKQHSFWVLPIIVMAGLFMALAVSSVYFYNQNVELRHTTADLSQQAEALQVANAEYKNKLYTLLEGETVAAFVAEHQLIKEKNPTYLEGKPISLIRY